MHDAINDNPVEAGPEGDVTRLIRLEQIDRDLFRNRFSEYERNDHLYGGQVLSQALAAAAGTTEGRICHSLHGYFLRAGSARRRVIFRVERTRDGGRFSTRRVVAEQNGTPIFHMECSFHIVEPGFEHHAPMPPGVPMPEDLPDRATLAETLRPRAPEMAAILGQFNLIDSRFIDPAQLLEPRPDARMQMWVRLPSAGGLADPVPHQQLLAYLSDFWLSSVGLAPHRPERLHGRLFVASLDHALWFHHPHDSSEWLLFDCDSPFAGHGRGLARGLLFNRAGLLVASTMQEALLRRG